MRSIFAFGSADVRGAQDLGHMFPISDDNPRIGTPMVTWSIMGACVLVFLWQVFLGEEQGQIAVFQFGMVPARLFGEA